MDWNAFLPDIIYTILGSVGYAQLVLAVKKRFGIPVVLHFMDEGATIPDTGNLLSGFVRWRYNHVLRAVLSQTKARPNSISEPMNRAYTKRYGKSFQTFMNTIDLDHYPARTDLAPGKTIRLAYTGAVLPYSQADSLHDISRAVKELHRQGVKIRLDVYSSLRLFKESLKGMADAASVYVHEAISNDDDYFRMLKEADIPDSRRSISPDAASIRALFATRCRRRVPSYLCSGTPILVYGPSEAAQNCGLCERKTNGRAWSVNAIWKFLKKRLWN